MSDGRATLPLANGIYPAQRERSHRSTRRRKRSKVATSIIQALHLTAHDEPSGQWAGMSKVKSGGKRAPTPIDAEVGRRVRARRVELGLSQSALGAKLGITYQQFQKCEKGINRIGASRLFQIAGALQVPISYFFEALVTSGNGSSPKLRSDTIDPNGLINIEGMKFALAYGRVRDPVTRRMIRGLVEDLASGRPNGSIR